MKWFGRDWGAPVCEPTEQVPTPAGDVCMQCGRVIEADDAGFMLPLVVQWAPGAPPGEARTEMRSWHLNCLLANMGLPMLSPGSFARVLGATMRILAAPDNRSITCPCGAVFLSGAAQRDRMGRFLCIDCGAAREDT